MKWDPAGSILASCGDDESVYLWSSKQSEPVKTLRDHTATVNAIRWSNSSFPQMGAYQSNSAIVPILATASLDRTIKLWDIEQGKVIMSLFGHK